MKKGVTREMTSPDGGSATCTLANEMAHPLSGESGGMTLAMRSIICHVNYGEINMQLSALVVKIKMKGRKRED